MSLKPKQVNKAEEVFGRVDGLLPKYSEIPDEFKRGGSPWCRWQQELFFNGLKEFPTPKEGIDRDAAIRHLAAINRSFEPKHEHKEAGVAYLASLWFESPVIPA